MPKVSAPLTATAIKAMKYDPANLSANKKSGGKGFLSSLIQTVKNGGILAIRDLRAGATL